MFAFILGYIILTILRPQDYLPAFADVPLMPITLIAAFVFWLFQRDKQFDAPQYQLLLGFLLVMMVSVALAGWVGGAVQQLEKFGPTVIAFFVLAAVAANSRRLVITMAVLVLCSAVLALHGVDQFHNGVGWTGMGMSEDKRIQYVGIFNDPNDLGLLFVSALPMAVYLFGRGGWFGLMRLLWLACIGLLLYGTYLTNSRGAMLALLAVIGVWVWRRRGIVTAGVLGAAGLAVMLALPSRLETAGVEDSSALGRVDAWYEGIHMFASHPLFGVGAGNFTEYNHLTAHNSFVLVLAETGFVGYLLWLAFVGYGLWMMLTLLRHVPELAADDAAAAAAWQRERALAMTLLLVQCGFLATAFFLSRSYIVVLYLLAAMALGHYTGARTRYPTLPGFQLSNDLLRWPLLAVASVVVLFVLVRILLVSA